jgi:hypothetical protein
VAASYALLVCEVCTFGKGALLRCPEAMSTAADASAPERLYQRMRSNRRHCSPSTRRARPKRSPAVKSRDGSVGIARLRVGPFGRGSTPKQGQ